MSETCKCRPDECENAGASGCYFGALHKSEEPDTHTQTGTAAGPDFCAECSEATHEWVTWPCASA